MHMHILIYILDTSFLIGSFVTDKEYNNIYVKPIIKQSKIQKI